MEYEYITTEQKIDVIKSHIMSIERDIYSAKLSIAEYSLADQVDDTFLNLIQEQIDQMLARKAMLVDQLNLVS